MRGIKEMIKNVLFTVLISLVFAGGFLIVAYGVGLIVSSIVRIVGA